MVVLRKDETRGKRHKLNDVTIMLKLRAGQKTPGLQTTPFVFVVACLKGGFIISKICVCS